MPVGSGDLLACMVESQKCLRQLRELCEQTARSGKYVCEMQAYKNALGAEIRIQSTIEIVTEIWRDFDASGQANEVTKAISTIFLLVNRYGKQNGSRPNRARSVRRMAANI